MRLLARLSGKSTTRTITKTIQHDTTKNVYRGVRIVTNESACCQAVRAVAGQRFLTKDVPMLPVGGCDAVECRCAYRHFDDRRADLRRASDVAYDIATDYFEQNHRSITMPGRRRTDRGVNSG